MSDVHPDPAPRVTEDGLASSYKALVADLAATLDLTTGAAEATHPATYTALVTDLVTNLDISAGLAAVLTPAAASPSPRIRARSPLRLSDYLRSLSPPRRLALRSRPDYSALRCTVELANRIYSVRDHIEALLDAFDSNRALDSAEPARVLDSAREPAHAFAHDLTRVADLGQALDDRLERDLARTITLAHGCSGALRTALDLDRAFDRDRDRALDHALARDRDRACTIARAHAGTLMAALPRALALALTLVIAIANSLDLNVDHDLAMLPTDEQHDGVSTRLMLTEWGVSLKRAGDDFIDADLRSLEHVAPGNLTGVRWSPATRWPPSWEDRVRSTSVKVEPGIFEIREDGWKRSLTEVST